MVGELTGAITGTGLERQNLPRPRAGANELCTR